MTTKRMILAVAVFALTSLFAVSAQAGDHGRYGGHYGCSRYPADFTSLYSGGQIQPPPHFSVHPPVYYSRPVARTYGQSPWAYLPETAPRQIGAVVVNPYVSQEAQVARVATIVSRVKNSHVAVAE